MNAETLANMPPEDVSLASLAQGLGTVLGRLDGFDKWREDEGKRQREATRRNEESHRETDRKLDALLDRVERDDDSRREMTATLGRLEMLLVDEHATDGLPRLRVRVTEVEQELRDDRRMRDRWRGFWRDPVTLAIIGTILTLIVAPLAVLARAQLRDAGELQWAVTRSTASCNAQYRGITKQRQIGNYTAQDYADRVLSLQAEGCPPPPDVGR